MCQKCDIVSNAFQAAQAEHFAALYAMLNIMVKNGQLQELAGDCPLEDKPDVLREEKHYTVCFYLECPACGECTSLAAASGASPFRHCEEIRWTKMTQDFSAMTRRRSAGILGVFQALTTKSEPKKTSQIVQIIFEQCLTNAWAIPAGKPSTAISGAIVCGGRRERIFSPLFQTNKNLFFGYVI